MKLFSKLFSIVLLSGVALSCCQEPQYATRAEKILAEMRNPNSDYVLVASHRGDWRNYPENSIPAIESVIRMGVDIMELDVKMTKDSVIVLSHDNSTRRCTNWKGEHGSGVDKQTLAEIKNLKLKTAHGVTTDSLRMPTLEEAFLVCKDRIIINIDQGFQYYDLIMPIAEKVGITEQLLIKGGAAVDFLCRMHRRRCLIGYAYAVCKSVHRRRTHLRRRTDPHHAHKAHKRPHSRLVRGFRRISHRHRHL